MSLLVWANAGPMRDVAVEAMCDGCDGAGVPLLPDEVDVARSVWGWVRVDGSLGAETAVCTTSTLMWCVECVAAVTLFASAVAVLPVG